MSAEEPLGEEPLWTESGESWCVTCVAAFPVSSGSGEDTVDWAALMQPADKIQPTSTAARGSNMH